MVGAQNRLIRGLVLALATFLVFPALAAGVDCNQIRDPFEQALCVSPRLSKLDSQLSAAYAAALARDPWRAAELKRDEIEWNGERNRKMWWLLAARHEFPSLPDNVDNELANFYQLRIAFLHNLDSPAATHDLPLARKLLASAPKPQPGEGDALKAWQSMGTMVLPKQHGADATSVYRVISTLAAPPSPQLRAALEGLGGPEFTVVYLPSAGLGGAFTIEGTADCQYWVLFEKRGDAAVPLRGGVGELSGAGCTRDGGSTGYLALIDGQPVALDVTNYPAFPDVTDLQWRRWLGGNRWAPPTRIRLRYGYTLEVDGKIYCPDAVPQCASTPAVALTAARHYLHDAFDLASLGRSTPKERTRFHHMQALAPGHADWASCASPVWFAARVGGKLAVGGISEAHVGCHPGGGFLEVGFWGADSASKPWWFADDAIVAHRDRLLFAALIPPSENP